MIQTKIGTFHVQKDNCHRYTPYLDRKSAKNSIFQISEEGWGPILRGVYM